MRLHGSEVLYHSGYSATELQEWAALARSWSEGTDAVGHPRDVYVYFDNDAQGHAPHDALTLARLAGGAEEPAEVVQ